MRTLNTALICGLLSSGIGLAQESGKGQEKEKQKRFSGPQVGEMVAPFRVLEVSGADAKEVTLMQARGKAAPKTSNTKSDAAKKPGDVALIVFSHKVTEPGIGLMMTLEWFTKKQKNVDAHFVMLTGDMSKTEPMVKRWARIPLLQKSVFSISLDGQLGPGRYGLNRNVEMTVLVTKKNKVTHNFALLGANTKVDGPKILKAVASAAGKPAPTVASIQEELRAERQKRRQRTARQRPLFRLAPNEELGWLMTSMVYREQPTEADVARVAKSIRKWAGEDEKKQADIRKYCKDILAGEFDLHRYAKEQIEELAKEEV